MNRYSLHLQGIPGQRRKQKTNKQSAQDLSLINTGPSAKHLLGTDDVGRDILSRLIWGGRVSMEVCTTVVILAIGIAFSFELLDLGVTNIAGRYVAAIPLMYVADLLPLVLGFGILSHGGIRLGFRGATFRARPAH